jgi:Xaa-Pro aminopeptidase
MTPPTITQRLQQLRTALQTHGAQAVIIPTSDPHLSEYLPDHWAAREWFSGFTGSAGTLLVSTSQAALLTDSRYWEQAERELKGSGIHLIKVSGSTLSHLTPWLAEHLQPNDIVAMDGQVVGLQTAQQIQSALQAKGLQLRTDINPLAQAWGARPALPAQPIFEHITPYADRSRAGKLHQVRQAMHEQRAQYHLISTLDDIAWLTNLRGQDVVYNPVFLAHILIRPERCTLFVNAQRLPGALHTALAADGFELMPYESLETELHQLPADACLLIDPQRITWGMRHQCPASIKVVEAINPSTLFKSRKTAAESAFIRQAMEYDGAAMCAFYAWFEQALGHEVITELTIDERISAERAKQPGFMGLSFPVIAGYNANGAMPHYRATAQAHATIEGHGLLLIDSGAQYVGGTTDITRVWPIGTPTAAMKKDYTLVLKGMMALSMARFPMGTPGPMLDAIARAPLWEQGIDFGHGTGHGVGYFLNVHEGPQSISKATPTPAMAMEAGMVTSIEPGVYRPQQWGVRIENLVLNRAAHTPEGESFGEFLEFETLTLCPIDTRCIEKSLLSLHEIEWLNRYNAEVKRRLWPHVSGVARQWLEARTQAI